MPVFLPPDRLDPWLTGNGGTEMLVGASPGLLQAWPVSRRVNSSKAPNDDATLAEAVPAG
jgi:putative SOS response-associated peptidase YedK